MRGPQHLAALPAPPAPPPPPPHPSPPHTWLVSTQVTRPGWNRRRKARCTGGCSPPGTVHANTPRDVATATQFPQVATAATEPGTRPAWGVGNRDTVWVWVWGGATLGGPPPHTTHGGSWLSVTQKANCPATCATQAGCAAAPCARDSPRATASPPRTATTAPWRPTTTRVGGQPCGAAWPPHANTRTVWTLSPRRAPGTSAAAASGWAWGAPHRPHHTAPSEWPCTARRGQAEGKGACM